MIGPHHVIHLQILQHLHGCVTVPADRPFPLLRGADRPASDRLKVLLVTDGHDNVVRSLQIRDCLSDSHRRPDIMERDLHVRNEKDPTHHACSTSLSCEPISA